jgi:phospholipase C
VFDHTSLIRFVEQRFGVTEPNITPWRRAVAGDLTSAFDFKTPNSAVTQLPSTVAYQPPDNQRHPDYKPAPPAEQSMPMQEPGTRPARALPYELHAHAQVDRGALVLTFRNTGAAAAVFHVRSGAASAGGPWSYTVGPLDTLTDRFVLDVSGLDVSGGSGYDFSVYGPNGFFRAFKGNIAANPAAEFEVSTEYDRIRSRNGVVTTGIALNLSNAGATACEVTILHGYTRQTERATVSANGTERRHWLLETTSGWYDVLVTVEADLHFQRHLAGHVETGLDSETDPAIGKA